MTGGEGTPAPIFDGFLVGCAIFAALLTATDWLLSSSQKDHLKYVFLSMKYYLGQHKSLEIANRTFSRIVRAVEQIAGERLLGVRRTIFYGVLATLSAPLFMTLGTPTDHWARIYGASGWAAFFLVFWLQISSMMWMLRTSIKKSLALFCLKLMLKVFASIGLAIILFITTLVVSGMLFPAFANLFGHPEIGIDYPREEVKKLGNNWVGFGIALYYLMIKAKVVICLSATFVPVVIATLVAAFTILLRNALVVFSLPLQVVFDRMVISDKGVLTQLGLGLAAAAKIAQEALKYLMHNS